MPSTDEIINSVNSLSKFWFDYNENQYSDHWWKAIQMLSKKSRQPSMDKELAYKTGLIWISLYELAGAVGAKSIKNSALIPLFVDSLAKKYHIDPTKTWKIFSEMSGVKMPNSIFTDIYTALDGNYEANAKEDPEVIQAFNMFSNQLISTNALGYVLDNLGNVTKS